MGQKATLPDTSTPKTRHPKCSPGPSTKGQKRPFDWLYRMQETGKAVGH